MSNAITARWPGTTMRLVPALATAVALAITLVTVSACGQGEDLTKGPEVPAVGSPTPPVCPASVTDDVAPTNTRKGPLVPSGATEALLCSYRFAAPEPAPLTATHRLTTGAAEVVAYLNGLSTSQPEGAACLMSGVTQHVVVVGYADRPAASCTPTSVVAGSRPARCGTAATFAQSPRSGASPGISNGHHTSAAHPIRIREAVGVSPGLAFLWTAGISPSLGSGKAARKCPRRIQVPTASPPRNVPR